MRLPRFALEHRAVVVGATAIAIAWGMIAFLTSPRRENPEYTIRTCLIVTVWPGASAEKIEQLVTDPIEKAVDSIDEVEKVTSTSRASYSVIFVDAEDSVTDTDGVWDKVRAKVENVQGQLPTGCREPLVNTDFGDTAAMVLAIYQDPAMAERHRYSSREMEVIAKRLKDEIKLLKAVADAQLYGVQQEAIYLEADVGTWSQLKLTTPILKAILRSATSWLLGKPVPSPIAVRLFGPGLADIQTMRNHAEKLKQVFRDSDNTWDVHDSWGDFGYQLNVNVAPDRANLAGVTNATIAQTLYTYLSGYPLTTYREGDHQVPVYLRLPAAQRSSPEILRRVYVEGFLGKVPLDAVAKVESVWEPAKIERYELNRMIEIQARPEDGSLPNATLTELMPGIRAVEKQLPLGYRIEISGEQEETVAGQRQVAKSFGISLLLIVLCLIVQYNSLVKPLMILMTLPLATIGAVVGLYLTGNPVGFMANLGMLSLFGIVLNAAIVYIEFAEILITQQLGKGEGLAQPGEKSCSGLSREAFRQCLARAGKMRILPISLTTVTTVGGLIPLALFGGPLSEAMAVVTIFGLLLATVLTLLVLPAVYAIFVENLRVKVAWEPATNERASVASVLAVN